MDQHLDIPAPAPLFLDPEHRCFIDRTANLGCYTLNVDLLPAHILVPRCSKHFCGSLFQFETHDNVLALPILESSHANVPKVFHILRLPSAMNLGIQENRVFRLFHGKKYTFGHGYQQLAHHVHKACANETSVRNERVSARAGIGHIDQQLAVQLVAKTESVDGARQAFMLLLVSLQVWQDRLSILRLPVSQQHYMSKAVICRHRAKCIKASNQTIPDIRATTTL
mmetsp:Transcript_8988/g.17175  ORF Transcript_8988/g.17175 Transcript_8988/m.17175 type:complete len:225 (+) Transcript_8988:529-1203(+)